jgi:putative glutathione S-transferase
MRRECHGAIGLNDLMAANSGIRIVNNESSEIIRIFNTAFNDQLPPEKAGIDVYPEELRTEIDEVNEWVYNKVNNGVYKTGFATTQQACALRS